MSLGVYNMLINVVEKELWKKMLRGLNWRKDNIDEACLFGIPFREVNF